MDTVFVEFEKRFKLPLNFLTVAVAMVLCLFSSKVLFAQESTLIANGIVPVINQVISNEDESKKFDESVNKRYRTGVIRDVDLGIKHIKMVKSINGRRIRINVVEVNRNLNPSLNVAPVLASDKLNSRVGISKIARKNNSIVAINGTFFKPQTGVPLGTLMIDGELQTGPIYDRVAMGIFDKHFETARVQLKATLNTRDEVIRIDNINQPRMLSVHTLLYTPKWGVKSAPTPKYGVQIGVSDNRVVAVSESALTIPEGGYVISGAKSVLGKLQVGDRVKVDVNTVPEWEGVSHIISGGPYLLKDGNVFIDVKEEKLPAITGRNPRTAIGYTADNNLVMVIVDGREKASVGMTLRELAAFMKSIGCYEAINLDGGGSSVLYIDGQIMNYPAQKGGIALSNALTVSSVQ